MGFNGLPKTSIGRFYSPSKLPPVDPFLNFQRTDTAKLFNNSLSISNLPSVRYTVGIDVDKF